MFNMKIHFRECSVYKDEELEEYLNKPNAYQDLLYVFGSEDFYERNTYTDGRDVNNIAFFSSNRLIY